YVGRWPEALAEFDRAEQIRPGLSTRSAAETYTLRLVSSICLENVGNLHRLRQCIDEWVWETHDRGNLSAEIALRMRAGYLLQLAADQPEEARRNVQDAIGKWSQKGPHMPHFYALRALTNIDLYTGNGEAAWRRLTERWNALTRTAMFRVQLVNIESLELRARSALKAAQSNPERTRLLASADRDIRRIEKQKTEWGGALATLLRASHVHITGRPGASGLLERAETAFEKVHMPIYAAAARRQRGVLLGDARLVASADDFLASKGIIDPGRIARLFAPGF